MEKIIIKKENATFSYPYFIKKGILGFAVVELYEKVYLNKNSIYVDFSTQSIIVEGEKTRLKFNLNKDEEEWLKSFSNKEKLNLTNFLKNMMCGEEKIYIFPEYERILVAPITYFDSDIQSSNMINKTFQLAVSKLTNNKYSKDSSYVEFQKEIHEKIKAMNFSKYKLLKENPNSNEVYISITMKEFISILVEGK